MNAVILSLIGIPWVVALLLLFSPKALGRALVISTAIALSGLSFSVFLSGQSSFSFSVPNIFNQMIIGLDVAMLLYFVWVAVKSRSWLVGVMSGLQIGVMAVLLETMSSGSAAHGAQFLVDRLSMFMYLLINVVSGLISVYALKYIDEENVSDQRKRNFMAILMAFIGVMNAIVSVDNIEWFFLLFETTTLASFLLIGFRKDPISERNALRALWMNQIGGVAILVALIVSLRTSGYGTLQFSELVERGPSVGVMLPFALISIAALIKGAQLPFSGWLMGAMVAPTPVSALLHSSTMVKLAPFILLKLSPAMRGSTVSYAIMLLCAFVFVVMAVGALARTNFKLILANSTIALLSLMCLLAAMGSEVAVMACLFLILFHGVSKCLLFLEAGVLEHVFHIKHTTHIQKLGEIGPRTAFFIGFGFVSLMLPPFGAFLGKWLGVEILAEASRSSGVVGILILSAIVLGSAVLSVLYFKVLGGVLMRSGQADAPVAETLSPFYVWVPRILALMLLAGMVFIVPLTDWYFAPVTESIRGTLSGFRVDGLDMVIGTTRVALWPLMGAMLLFPVVLYVANFVRFRGVDRVKEYACGEVGPRAELDFSAYYFSIEKYEPLFVAVGVAFFISIVLTGRIPL